MKKVAIDVDKICENGKLNGVSYTDMASRLEISRQRLYELRHGNRIETMDFINLCELCLVDPADWKDYIKEIK